MNLTLLPKSMPSNGDRIGTTKISMTILPNNLKTNLGWLDVYAIISLHYQRRIPLKNHKTDPNCQNIHSFCLKLLCS